MFDALLDAARVSHYHPLRPHVSVEVLTLGIRSHEATRVREAVDALAALHASGDNVAFCTAMTTLSPWRSSYLYAKGISSNTFPWIAIHVSSEAELAAAEAFFSEGGDETANHPHQLALVLRIELSDEDIEDAYDALSRIMMLLSDLTSASSRFELKAVEIGFDADRMGDRELEMMRRVLVLALHECTPTPAFKIDIGSIGNESVSFLVWAKFFQTLCRVGAERRCGDEGNELAVAFAERADPHVIAAFWSAVAFTAGYTRLILRTTEAPTETTVAKYMALALLSPVSDVRHLDWSNSLFQEYDIDAMLQVQGATSLDELSSVLWTSEWSSEKIPLTTVNPTIARQFGWVLHDTGDRSFVDVFVPGFGQCRVNRKQWNNVIDDPCPQFSGLFQASNLQRFESVLQLDHRTAHLEASRFLQMIGRSLEYIELKPRRYLCSLSLVLTIFESCPRLRELTVHQLQIPRELMPVDPSRLVSTSMIKLRLLFGNEPSLLTRPTGAFTQELFETVIPVVGQKLEYLEVYKRSGIIPFASAFATIARSCASLFHLKLFHVNVGTLDPLIEAYRNGTSRVSSLYLQKTAVESSAIVRFAEFLSVRSCPGSTKLGVLHITHFSDDVGDAAQLQGLDAAAIKAILAMLEQNRTLTELYLIVTDRDVGTIVPDPLRPFKRRFDVYNEQEIPIASEKYPIESTLAFVDALQRQQFPYTQETISIITQFAAERIRRSVRYDVVN